MECFCGCGRRVRRGRRAVNEHGRQTKQLVDRLAELDLYVDRASQEQLDRGREWLAELSGAVHGEIPLKALDLDRWRDWQHAAARAIAEVEANYAKIGNWVRQEGLSSEQAAAAMAGMNDEQRAALYERLGIRGEPL